MGSDSRMDRLLATSRVKVHIWVSIMSPSALPYREGGHVREFVTLPSIVTSGNLAAGFLAILAIQTNVLLAAVLVIVAAVLGSLADLVSFGIVLALALYAGPLRTLPILGLTACLGFLLCGTWHLA